MTALLVGVLAAWTLTVVAVGAVLLAVWAPRTRTRTYHRPTWEHHPGPGPA